VKYFLKYFKINLRCFLSKEGILKYGKSVSKPVNGKYNYIKKLHTVYPMWYKPMLTNSKN